VVRWSIPGSVVVLVALSIYVLAQFFERGWGATGPLIDVTPGVVALFALATVPLGYLVYQIYYSREGRVRWIPGLIPVDRGHYILEALRVDHRQVALQRLNTEPLDAGLFTRSPQGDRLLQRPQGAERKDWPNQKLSLIRYHRWTLDESIHGRRPRGVARLDPRHPHKIARRRLSARYYAESQRHLAVVRTLLAMLAADDEGKALAIEYTSLSDIYHGLGATRTALALGVPSGGLVYLVSGDVSVEVLVLATCVVGLVAGGLYYSVHVNRSEVLGRLLLTAHHGLNYVLDGQARKEKMAGETPS